MPLLTVRGIFETEQDLFAVSVEDHIDGQVSIAMFKEGEGVASAYTVLDAFDARILARVILEMTEVSK